LSVADVISLSARRLLTVVPLVSAMMVAHASAEPDPVSIAEISPAAQSIT
jgi:hypothetical protein